MKLTTTQRTALASMSVKKHSGLQSNHFLNAVRQLERKGLVKTIYTGNKCTTELTEKGIEFSKEMQYPANAFVLKPDTQI